MTNYKRVIEMVGGRERKRLREMEGGRERKRVRGLALHPAGYEHMNVWPACPINSWTLLLEESF